MNNDETNTLSVLNFKKLLDKKVERFDGKRLALTAKFADQKHRSSSLVEIAWEVTKSYSLNGFQTMEVPYLVMEGNVNLYNFRKRFVEDDEKDNKLRVAYSYTNLVYYKRSNSDMENILMVNYIPEAGVIRDLKYFKTDERMSLRSIDSFFSGYLEYKSLDGAVLSVEYYESGKITGRYSLSENKSRNMSKTSQTCTTVCKPIYGMVCVSVPEHTEGETCTQQVVGQNCTQVCQDNDPDPEIPTPGGGGPTNPSYAIAQSQALINQVFEPCTDFQVGSENYETFLNEVQTLMDGSAGESFACFTQKMLNFLAANGSSGKIQLCLDENVSMDAYIPGTKKMVFHNNSNIDYSVIFHELFHACQGKIYPSGINQYGGQQGKAEIEFETHLFIDIVGRFVGNSTLAVNSPKYTQFLNGLTTDNNGNRNLYNAKMYFEDIGIGQNSSYHQYKTMFKQKFPNYSTPDFNLSPLALKHFLNNFNCYL